MYKSSVSVVVVAFRQGSYEILVMEMTMRRDGIDRSMVCLFTVVRKTTSHRKREKIFNVTAFSSVSFFNSATVNTLDGFATPVEKNSAGGVCRWALQTRRTKN